MVVVSMINGMLLPKTPRFAPWYIIGSALALVGTALMCMSPTEAPHQSLTPLTDTTDEHTPNANIYGYSILIGVGVGCYVVAGFPIAQALVPASEIGNAVGCMTVCKSLNRSSDRRYKHADLGTSPSYWHDSVPGHWRRHVPEPGHSQHQLPHARRIGGLRESLIVGTSSAAFQQLSEADKALVIEEVTDAMGSVWLLFTCAAALSFVLSIPLAVRTSLEEVILV